jgi:hypothetical protein
MPVFDGFLMRDALNDDGTVPSPGYPYYSPDLIAHAQVADAKPFFTANYATDPNQPVELGSKVNYFYVRAKNLSAGTLSGYYITVYRANASLFLRPSIWKHNLLKTQEGNAYVSLDSTASNAIAVGNNPFLLDGISSSNFCLIGIASNSPTPSIPSDFSTYEGYITWVRQNQNVCGRNLRLVRNFPNRDYEQLDQFSNPETVSVPTLFQVTIHGTLPANSTFGLISAPLGLNTTWNVNDGTVQTASAMTPANFTGNVTTWAILSSGSWPSGVWIETVVFVGVSDRSLAAQYRETEWSQLGGAAPEVIDATRPHLVRVGNCATKFLTTS